MDNAQYQIIHQVFGLSAYDGKSMHLVVLIRGIVYTDHCGVRLDINGLLSDAYHGFISFRGIPFKGYYDTQIREGWLTVEIPVSAPTCCVEG